MSLALDYKELRREVGRFLGYPRDPAGWFEQQTQDVEDILASGLRRAYWPPPLKLIGHDGKEREGAPHGWLFLRPVSSLEAKTGIGAYQLPEDFTEFLEGGITYSGGSISLVPESQIRGLPAASGAPLYAALRVQPVAVGSPSRYELLLYPTPDADKTLTLRYGISPPKLSDDNPYPLGGPQHSQLILEACLAEAEVKLGDAEGVHSKRFLEVLAKSIQADIAIGTVEDSELWPISNEATDLGVNKAYLKRLIGWLLKFGANADSWSHSQQQQVKLALEIGLRKFYKPPLVGSRFGWEWSFLFPTVRLGTIADQYAYDLPEDFAMLQGPLTYAPGSNAIYPELRMAGEHQIRQRLQRESFRGRPTMAAYRPKPPDASGATRYELLLWPVPDATYDISYRYRFNPGMLSDEAVLPCGGTQHAQTIVEACLAAVEELQGKLGVHSVAFMSNLASSIAFDQKASSPEGLGYNRDRSDGSHSGGLGGDWRDCVVSDPVTYNGQLYD